MAPAKEITPQQKAASLLKELGVAGTAGYDDLLEIIAYLQAHHKSSTFPSLKKIFTAIAEEHAAENIQKEAKTIEQRLRRAVFQAMVSTASMGVVDYTNPKFEEYAPFYFDYAEVCSVIARSSKTRSRRSPRSTSTPRSSSRRSTPPRLSLD